MDSSRNNHHQQKSKNQRQTWITSEWWKWTDRLILFVSDDDGTAAFPLFDGMGLCGAVCCLLFSLMMGARPPTGCPVAVERDLVGFEDPPQLQIDLPPLRVERDPSTQSEDKSSHKGWRNPLQQVSGMPYLLVSVQSILDQSLNYRCFQTIDSHAFRLAS